MYFIIHLIFLVSLSTAQKTFPGYSLFKVIPKSNDDVKILRDLQINGIVEYWQDQFDVNYDVRTMVSKENRNVFLKELQNSAMQPEELISDLQRVIDEQLHVSRSSGTNTTFLSMNWERYHTLQEIYSWLDELESNYPDIVTTVVMGTSFENRQIKGIRINYKQERSVKYIGMLEGTLHAREWISPATVTWIIKEFLTSDDPEVRALAENLEWHIFPVVNPDGYEYTFTTHRMWRKNRSTQSFTSCNSTGVDDDMSNGVDLNRNFDFEWMSVGASDNPCSNTYAGPSPMSEPEAKAISQYVLNLKNQGQIIYYISFHSYTQLVVIPYSHVAIPDVLSIPNYADMFEIAAIGGAKLTERYGTPYRVGISADVLYPMSGASFDWVKYAANVPVSYLIELRDLGEFGFLLPAQQIVPNNLEIMDMLLEMDRTTRRLGYYSGSQTTAASFIILAFGFVLARMI